MLDCMVYRLASGNVECGMPMRALKKRSGMVCDLSGVWDMSNDRVRS
jgi:hypothetical protein